MMFNETTKGPSVSSDMIIRSLEACPSPPMVWAAFRADVIDMEDVIRLLPPPRLTFWQQFADAITSVFGDDLFS